MYNISFLLTVFVYVFAASYFKVFIHESGHVLALAVTDFKLRKDNPEYIPQTYIMKSRHGDGRVDSGLYAILAENCMLGWIRFNAIMGFLAECITPHANSRQIITQDFSFSARRRIES